MTRHGTWYRRTAALAVVAASAVAVSSGTALAGVSIDIEAPAAGATYEAGRPVTIDYTCTSPFTIIQCVLFSDGGTLVPGTPLDTSAAHVVQAGPPTRAMTRSPASRAAPAHRPNGARLNTGFTALGRHSFTVTATDKAGNVTKATHTYTVTLL